MTPRAPGPLATTWLGAGLLIAVLPAAAPGQTPSRSLVAVEAGVLRFGLRPDFASRERIRSHSLGVQVGLTFPVRPGLGLGLDLAALSLPARVDRPPDSISPTHDATTAGWISLAASARSPAVVQLRRTSVSLGLGAGLVRMRGSRTTLRHGAGSQPLGTMSRRLDVHGGFFLEPSVRLSARRIGFLLRHRLFERSADVRGATSLGVVLDLSRGPPGPVRAP